MENTVKTSLASFHFFHIITKDQRKTGNTCINVVKLADKIFHYKLFENILF